VPDTGLDIEYVTPYYGPGTTPNIQVSIDGAQAGDRPSITSKTLSGFNIVILDDTDNPVERQVDIAIKGYGYKSDTVI